MAAIFTNNVLCQSGSLRSRELCNLRCTQAARVVYSDFIRRAGWNILKTNNKLSNMRIPDITVNFQFIQCHRITKSAHSQVSSLNFPKAILPRHIRTAVSVPAPSVLPVWIL